MSQGWKIGLAVAAIVTGLGLTGAITVLASVHLWRSASEVDLPKGLYALADHVFDEQADVGFASPVIHADDPLLKERKILLSHDVNVISAKDVVGRLFYLDSVDSKKPIDLYITTAGGWPDDAFAIIDAMQLIDAPVNTWAIGGCYSAGAMILAAGTGRRVATQNVIIMVHTNLDDSSAKYSFDRLDRARYEELFKRTADLPEAWYPMTSDARYYLDAEQAREFRLVDEVVDFWNGAAEAPSD